MVALAGAAALAAAGSANAVFFSFASDNGDSYFTFRSTSNTSVANSFNIVEGSPAGLPGPAGSPSFSAINLVIDDNNGPLAARVLRTKFTANLVAANGTSTQIFPGLWQHNYLVTGSFSFLDAVSGATLLTATIGANGPAVLSVPGPNANTWSTAGAVLGADSFGVVTYTAFPALVNAINALGGPSAADFGLIIPAGSSSVDSLGPDDFGFDLTVINVPNAGAPNLPSGINVALGTNKVPLQNWASEGSYSGSAAGGFIPAPGAAALLGLGGLIAARRRRTA
jgi:hypothetical protein